MLSKENTYVQDNADALDMPTVEAWTLIWRCFVSEYLNMDTILHSEL